MKTFFTTILPSIKRNHLFPFGTLIAILLSIFCLCHLLCYPVSAFDEYHSYSTKALAKNLISEQKPNTISDAHLLSLGKEYSKTIPAYETFYYGIPYTKSFSFLLRCTKVKRIKTIFFSDTGKKFPCSTSFSKNQIEYKGHADAVKQTQYLFIQMTNHSPYDLSLDFCVKISPKKTKKKSTSNHKEKSSSTSPAKKPKRKLSTIIVKNPLLYPHFLIMEPHTTKKISVKGLTKQELSKCYNWISTNPKAATIKNQKISALSEGTAIIYLQSKNPKLKNSCCFVRIIQNKKKKE